MRRSLRNRHLYLWIALALILPLLVGLAAMMVIIPQPGSHDEKIEVVSRGDIVTQQQTENFTLRIRRAGTRYFLEVEPRRQVISPALFVFLNYDNEDKEFNFERAPFGALSASHATEFELPKFDGILWVVIADVLHREMYANVRLSL